MSSVESEQPKGPSFQPAEEKWFAGSQARRHARPIRWSLTPRPSAPIGDPLADAWFR